MNVFVVGDGGFGGPRASDVLIKTEKSPTRTPDRVREFKTSIDQVSRNISQLLLLGLTVV